MILNTIEYAQKYIKKIRIQGSKNILPDPQQM